MKKRTSLDAVLTPRLLADAAERTDDSPISAETETVRRRPQFKQQTAYLPLTVHEQLRRLAFEEHAKMHDYLLEGLDLVFRKRGLPSVIELTRIRATD